MKRLDQIRSDYSRACKALADAVREAQSELEIDGAIQRCEFTFELLWKMLGVYLRTEGIVAQTPNRCLKEAYRLGLLADEKAGLQMLDDRNLSVHLYDLATSRKVFQRIKEQHLPLLVELERRVGE